jgi:hypothetical protein
MVRWVHVMYEIKRKEEGDGGGDAFIVRKVKESDKQGQWKPTVNMTGWRSTVRSLPVFKLEGR